MKRTRYYNITIVSVFFALLLGAISCKVDEEDVLFTGDDYQNMMQYIEADPNFESFKKIVEAGSMTDALSSYNSNGGSGYTLFLATNAAVDLFVDENERYASLDALVEDAAYCAEIVRYHLVNGRIPSSDFPNGALADKTISNYFLTIFFREGNDEVSYSVNDEAEVILTDIDLDNGVIHLIDKMLTPVVFTSYEWVTESNDFTIFAELLTQCGLADTLNAFELDELGREIYNEYTVMAESDELYAENGIHSFNDLVNTIDDLADQDFTNPENAVNKYARYHILELSVFLDEFATEVYNTYGDFPMSVDLTDILKFNAGSKVYDEIITEGDTLVVDYLQIKLEKSNIVTKSGAIHQLDHLLYPYLPGRKTVTFQFYEEPYINAVKNIEGTYLINLENLEYIDMIGEDRIIYVKSASDIEGASNRDYIATSGDIDFSFVTPKVLAGRYKLKLVLQRGASNMASVQALVDDKKVGVVIDLTKDSRTFRTFTVGTVEFSDYSTHTVKLSTVIPGALFIDRIIFEPIS